MGNALSCFSSASSPNEKQNDFNLSGKQSSSPLSDEKQNDFSLPGKEVLNGLHELMPYIEKCLATAIAADKAEKSASGVNVTTSDRVTSSINYGSYLLENVLNRFKHDASKIMSDETRKVVIDVLKEASHIHWVAAALSVVAYLSQKVVDDASANKKEIVQLLRNMYDLAKHIKELGWNGNITDGKLNDVAGFIVKGSFFCISRIKSCKLSRFFSSEVDVGVINSLQSELGKKYPDLKFQAVTGTLKERSTELPPSQDTDSDEDDKQNAFDSPQKDVLSDPEELISYIEKCLAKPAATHKVEEETSAVDGITSGRMARSITRGENLLKNVLERCKKHASKIMSGETRKVVIDVLKEAAQMNLVAAGLCIVAYVSKKVDDASTNKEKCVQFLRDMCDLAKHIKELDRHIHQEKLHDVFEFIFKGSFFCVSRIKSSSLSRFFSSEVDVEEIKSLQSQLVVKYSYLQMEVGKENLNRLPIMLPPTQGEYPDAVGINEARDKVMKLLNLRDQSTRGVVLYGVGGIGKTTLASAVFSSVKLNAYKHCRVNIQQDCSDSDLKQLQEQLLNDLFAENIKLRNCEEGREKLSNLFRLSTQPLFLFIDNALTGSDLAKLLPKDLSCLPKGSRILITTRKLDETDMIKEGGVKRYEHGVEPLSEAESKKLLCCKALGGADYSFDKSLDIDDLVKICGGMPLVLEMAGSELRGLGNNVQACENTIELLKDTLLKGEGELSEKIVDVVYNNLQYDVYKDAFLDIAVFFHNWDQRIVGFHVGERALKALQEAALVKISEQGKVIVHDIVLARARKMSKGDRITDHQSLRRVLQDRQRVEKVKGIWLPRKSLDDESIQAEDLDKMGESLRVLRLASGTKVTGVCTRKFENLRYLVIDNGDRLPMELNMLPRLAVLEGRIRSDDRFCDLPDSLRSLKVNDLESLGLAESSCDLQTTQSLPGSRALTSLLESSGQLRSLEETDLSGCASDPSDPEELDLSQNRYHMTRLPQSFGQLEPPRRLRLSGFRELQSLPESIGQLRNVLWLRIENCSLTSLPETFGELKDIKYFKLRGCASLTSLPERFGQLKKLKELNIIDCARLSGLPNNFGQLEHLEYLRFRGCESLQRVSDDFRSLRSVTAIDASRCPLLEGEAVDQMMDLNSLMMVDIRESPMLRMRWEQVKDRHPVLVRTNSMQSMECMFKHSMSTALFDGESGFVNADGVVGDWLSPFTAGKEKIAFLVTCCDLCSPSNEEAFEMVKKKIAELACEGFHIMYVGLMEQSEEHAAQTLLQLSQGISGDASLSAWIPPSHKWKEFFGFSAAVMVSQLMSGVHTFIARADVSASEQGKQQVEDLKLIFPKGEDEEGAMTDFEGSFSTLYSRMINIGVFLEFF